MTNSVIHESWGAIEAGLDCATDIAFGTLELSLLRSTTDVMIKSAYPQDKFWTDSKDRRNESRVVFAGPDSGINLQPVGPPRNIVARPILDMFIPAGESTTVFVGYPAWLKVVAAQTVVLADLATELMSETWLGSNTREGEVAYATPTQARLSRSNLPQTTHTIRTPITIKNSSSERLQVSRLSIPAPALAIFRSEGRLWTPTVSITCEEELSQARLEIGHSAPHFLTSAEKLSDARRTIKGSNLRRAIGLLLG